MSFELVYLWCLQCYLTGEIHGESISTGIGSKSISEVPRHPCWRIVGTPILAQHFTWKIQGLVLRWSGKALWTIGWCCLHKPLLSIGKCKCYRGMRLGTHLCVSGALVKGLSWGLARCMELPHYLGVLHVWGQQQLKHTMFLCQQG